MKYYRDPLKWLLIHCIVAWKNSCLMYDRYLLKRLVSTLKYAHKHPTRVCFIKKESLGFLKYLIFEEKISSLWKNQIYKWKRGRNMGSKSSTSKLT